MNPQNYSFPLLDHWNQDEIVQMIDFYVAVEKAYAGNITKQEFMDKYRIFQKIEPAKMVQKQLDKAFARESGYSIYKAFKTAQNLKDNQKIRVE